MSSFRMILQDGANMTSLPWGDENRQYTLNKATYFIAKVLPMKIFKALAEMLKMLGNGLLKYFFINSEKKGFIRRGQPPSCSCRDRRQSG